MTSTLRGSCLCGAIRYILSNVSEDCWRKTSICHCRPCRKITGTTGSLNLVVSASSFDCKQGELKIFRTTHSDDGFEFSIAFCGDCGSPIYGQPHLIKGIVQDAEVVVIQVGTLDDIAPLEVTPVQEINIKHRLPWVGKLESAVQKETYVE